MLLGDPVKQIDKGFLFDTWSLGRNNLAIRATFLQDATLLNFTMPHSVVDAHSLFDVVCAFCALLKNDPIHKIQLPPDVRGIQMSRLVRDDVQGEKQPIDSDCQASYNDHRQTWRPNLYSITKVCGNNFKTEFLTSKLGFSKMQDTLICIPQKWLDTARKECMRERDLDESLGNITTQLSKNDTMIAWFLKLLFGHESQRESIDLLCPLDIHAFTKQEESEAPYLHNDFSTPRCHFTAAELKKNPNHWIANRVRNTLLSYRNAASARDYWRFLEDSASKIKMPNSTGQSVYVTSWAAFDFANLDFSGATAHGDSMSRPPVLFLCPKVSGRLLSVVDGFFVSWKDANGDFWIRGCMPADVIRSLDVL